MSKNNPEKPPKIFRWLLSEDHLETLFGDILELYQVRKKSVGTWRARLLYYKDAISLLKPFAMKRRPRITSVISKSLLGSYFRLSWRNLVRNRLSSSINVIGLMSAFAASILIAQYVYFELNFDRFHPEYENTYRVSFQHLENGQMSFCGATTFLPVGKLLHDEFPEIENYCRLYYPFTHASLKIEDQLFYEDKPVFAENSFFEIFGFNLIHGARSTALSEPNSVVISKSLARRYFQSEDPIGRQLKFSFEDGSTLLQVTGVMEDPREDSHLKLPFLISFKTLDQWPVFRENEWRFPFYHTYFQAGSPLNLPDFHERSSTLLKEFRPSSTESEFTERFLLQPIKDIHLDSNLAFELEENGDRRSVYFLVLVAVMILLIAYLNYINLSTAITSMKGKEIGIHKVMGSTRSQLIHRFILEAFLVNGISLILAIILVFFLVKPLSGLFETTIPFTTEITFWAWIIGIVFTGTFVASIYPAIIVAGFKSTQALKSAFSIKASGGSLRKILISIQFGLSILMIGGMILISKQTNFILTKDLGFDAEKLLVMGAPRDLQNENFAGTVRSFENTLIQNANIHNITSSGSVPGKVMGSATVRRSNKTDSEGTALYVNGIGYQYFETYGIQFLAGRSYSRSFISDSTKVILNETASQALGFDSPEKAVGQLIQTGTAEFEVLGVVEDYHHSSLKSTFKPIVFVFSPDRMVYFTLNLNTGDLNNLLSYIEEEYQQHFPEHPLEYFFLDQVFEHEFKTEKRYTGMLKIFSLLAVIIASMGLFGLSSFAINQRAKEIGLRKVLGASVTSFMLLLGRFFLLPTLLGTIMSFLILIYVGRIWLDQFPYRIGFDWVIFVIPLVMVLLLTGVNLVLLSLRASRINPVALLKSE